MFYFAKRGRVTTKSADVKTFLRKNPTAIIYSTYQSLDVVQQALKGTKLQFDLTLCDEAHKTAGDKKGAFASRRKHKPPYFWSFGVSRQDQRHKGVTK